MSGDFVFPEFKPGDLPIPVITERLIPGPNIIWSGSLDGDRVNGGEIENMKAQARQAMQGMHSDELRLVFCEVMAEWFLEESKRIGRAAEEKSS